MSPTLRDYRRALARSRDGGGYLPLTLTSTSVSSTKERELICSDLIDDTPSISSRYSAAWVYGTDEGTGTLAGEQRRLRQLPLDPATGTLYTTRVFATEPVIASTWELYFRIPAILDVASGRDGYRELINQALALMVVPPPNDRIAVTGVSDQTHYTLDTTTHWWLADPGRVVNVIRPSSDPEAHDMLDTSAWAIIRDGASLVLDMHEGVNTGDTFYLQVQRPANSLIVRGGTGYDQSSPNAGLEDDSDGATPSVNDVVTVARELMFAELGRNAPEAEARFWAAKEADAGRAAAGLKFVAPTDNERPMQISTNVSFALWR